MIILMLWVELFKTQFPIPHKAGFAWDIGYEFAWDIALVGFEVNS